MERKEFDVNMSRQNNIEIELILIRKYNTYSNRPKVFVHRQILMYRLCHLSTKESVGTKMGIEICRDQKFIVLALTLVKIFDFLTFHEVLIYY